MPDPFSRTRMLLGDDAMERLSRSRVAVFGVGGVGGYVVEALCRAGIGALDLIDNDTVSLTNLNRQIVATRDTLGRDKVDVAAERVRSINPDCAVRTDKSFFLPETADRFDFTRYDYVVDAIDTVAGKLALVEKARAAGVPIISALGTGNKLDPTKLEIGDIYATSVCPLARVMRRELRRRGVDALKVLWSREEPLTPLPADEETERRALPGSTPFVPAAGGLIIAAEVVRDLLRAPERPARDADGAVYRDARFTLGWADGEPYLTADGTTYALSCQPYEPCTCLYRDGALVAAVHSAFDPDAALRAFARGERVAAITGRTYDARRFCELLAFSAQNCVDTDVSWVEGALAVERLKELDATAPDRAVTLRELDVRAISDRFSRSRKLTERVMYTDDGRVYLEIKYSG